MPLDRKRKGSDHESAISKLRRGRSEGSRTPTGEATATDQAVAPLKRPTLREKSRRTEKHGSRETLRPEPLEEPLTQQEADDNSFAALAQKAEIQGNRIYERLAGKRLRVELSAGADCVIAGRCTLWVKHGTVAVMGAILHASPVLHKISAPTTLSLPAIRAIQGDAEIELGELAHLSGQDSARISHSFKLLPPIGSMGQGLGYQVLGLDFSLVAANARRPRLLTLDGDHFRNLSETGSSHGLCVVLGGSRSSEVMTMARCILNRLATAQRQGPRVLFIDLASNMPVFTAPGMLSLVMLRSCVLGPSFDRLCQQGVDIVRQQFVGPVSTELQATSWFQACFKDLISTLSAYREEHPRTPVLINIGNTTVLDQPLVEYLWKTQSPSSVQWMESQTLTPTMDRFSTLANQDSIPFRLVPTVNENPHSSRFHNFNTQSYFNTLQDSAGAATFQMFESHLNFPEICFRYGGSAAELLAVTSVDTSYPHSNIHKAVSGLLAAVVLTDSSTLTAFEGLVRRCPTSRLPVFPPLTSLGLEADRLVCLGLCYVISTDIAAGSVTIVTPVSRERIEAGLRLGQGIILVVQPPTREGTFAALKT